MESGRRIRKDLFARPEDNAESISVAESRVPAQLQTIGGNAARVR